MSNIVQRGNAPCSYHYCYYNSLMVLAGDLLKEADAVRWHGCVVSMGNGCRWLVAIASSFGPCAQLLPLAGAETGQQCPNAKGKGRWMTAAAGARSQRPQPSAPSTLLMACRHSRWCCCCCCCCCTRWLRQLSPRGCEEPATPCQRARCWAEVHATPVAPLATPLL